MDGEALRASWSEALDMLGVEARHIPATQHLRDRLIAAYGEPHRHYHTLQHLGECLTLFRLHAAAAERPGEVAMALWFHDAIYDVHAHDNEARSADWAHDAMLALGVAPASAQRVHALAMATQHDAQPEGADARLLVDIDLSILGAERARFDEYERQVHLEYAFVPDEVRLPRRRAILQRFLDRPAIYSTPPLHALLEARARDNLQRSINAPCRPSTP